MCMFLYRALTLEVMYDHEDQCVAAQGSTACIVDPLMTSPLLNRQNNGPYTLFN